MVPRDSNGVVIGLDGRTLGFGQNSQRGIGSYTTRHLEHIIRRAPGWKFRLYIDEGLTAPSLARLSSLPSVEQCTFDASLEPPSLFHIPDAMSFMHGFDSPFLIAPRTKLSVLFYDLIPLIERAHHFDSWPQPMQLSYMRRLRQIRESDSKVLAISECTKRDLNRYGQVPDERIEVIHGGIDGLDEPLPTESEIASTLQKYGLRKPYFMTVGGLDGHKNFVATAEAFVATQRETGAQLCIVGSDNDPYKSHYREMFQRNSVTSVIFTGFVEGDELRALYAGSAGLSFPSLYEGFGLPVVEAMARCCPVITSNTSSLVEVAGDAAIVVAPKDVAGIAKAMVALVRDPGLRAELIEKGRLQAQQFNWPRVADKTIQIWQGVLGQKSVDEPRPQATAVKWQTLMS
jgi:glycosyltransferase involved in cell wall biosynthesis